jgi:hypothetical protein
MDIIMKRFYLEYHTRDIPFTCKVVTTTSFEEAKALLPGQADFTLPDYMEDGWHVSVTYWEWAEPIKDFMDLWYNEAIIHWYRDNLVPSRWKRAPVYEPNANKRAWKRFKQHISNYYEFTLRFIIGFIIGFLDMCYDIWYNYKHKPHRKN